MLYDYNGDIKTLVERWDAYQEAVDRGDYPFDGKDYAIRGDGALVIFDKYGWFLIVKTGPGPNPGEKDVMVPNVLKLEGPHGDQEEFYCEPIWLSGYYDELRNALYGAREDLERG